MSTLENQTILIVGGSSGIGFGVAKLSLLSQAAKVIIASSSAAKVQDAVKRLEAVISEKNLPGRVEGGTVDASTTDAVKEFVTGVGEIDHLVWTSGDSLSSGFKDVDISDARNVFNVRFWGAVAAAQSVKIRPGGSIVLTTGMALLRPMKNWSVVVAVAGAVDSVTRGLAVDLAPIRVNSVCPGLIDTELLDRFPEDVRNAMFKSRAERLPVKHIGTAEECAEAYLFFMKCTYATGQRLEVDGGDLLT